MVLTPLENNEINLALTPLSILLLSKKKIHLYDKKRGFWHSVSPPHKHFVIASRIYYTSFGNVSPRISRELEANKSPPPSAVQPEDALNLLKKAPSKKSHLTSLNISILF